MAVYFFDSSALVKRYAQEPGTTWVVRLTDVQAQNVIYLASITSVEVTAAIARRWRGGSLSPTDAATALADFRYDLARQYVVLDLVPAIISQAESLAETHALRGYDAVQLAAALALQRARQTAGLSAIMLVSADRELNAAALAEGLAVDDPNNH